MYRPLLANKVSMTELKTCVTINDLLEINALLDMQEDIKYQVQQKHESKLKNRHQ
jgi:hypothetical protein